MAALTVKELEKLSREDGRHAVGDGTGLALLVRDTGRRRMWVQRITVAGKVRELGHGTYPAVSVAKARAAAKKVHDHVAAGLDPVALRREKEAGDKAATDQTLAAALTGYIDAHGAAWRSEKTRRLTRTSLEQHAKALLSRPVRDIKTGDVLSVLRPIWSEKPVQAQKVRSRLEGVFDWAKGAGWREGENPAAWKGVLKPLLAKPSAVTRNRHHPALPWERVPNFLAELRDENGTAPRCLELVILTAVRSGEARGATWGEFDLDGAIWTIPKGRMKADREHRVPLSAPALALLQARLPRHAKPIPGALVFPTSADTALSDMALLAVVKRMDAAKEKAEGKGWRDESGLRITPHGFRSTFRNWAGDTGQPWELAEHALAHAVGSETARAYARSDLLARRARLMAAWAAHCVGLTAVDEVTASPGASGHVRVVVAA